MGETGADMFSMTYNFGSENTILLFMGIFMLFLAIKLSIKRYEPLTYWLTFTATAIAGTAISDYIDRTLGFGYTSGSLLLIALLVMILPPSLIILKAHYHSKIFLTSKTAFDKIISYSINSA